MGKINKLIIVVLLLFVQVACKAKPKVDAATLLAKVPVVMGELKSYSITLDIKITGKLEDSDNSVDAKVDLDVFLMPKKAKGELHTDKKVAGKELETAILMYLEENTAGYEVFSKEGDSWSKPYSVENVKLTYAEDYCQLLEAFKEAGIKNEKYHEIDAYRLEAEISGEMLLKAIKQAGDPLTGAIVDLLEVSTSKIPTIVYIDKEKNYLLSLSFDLGAVVDKGILQPGKDVTVSDFSALLTIDFRNFNKLGNFSVPQEAKNVGVKQEEKKPVVKPEDNKTVETEQEPIEIVLTSKEAKAVKQHLSYLIWATSPYVNITKKTKLIFAKLDEQDRLNILCGYRASMKDKKVIEEEGFFVQDEPLFEGDEVDPGENYILGTGGYVSKYKYINGLFKTMYGNNLDKKKLYKTKVYDKAAKAALKKLLPAAYVHCSTVTGGIEVTYKVTKLMYDPVSKVYTMTIDFKDNTNGRKNVFEFCYKSNGKDATFINSQFISLQVVK